MGFADVLGSGKFIVTAEVTPPKGTDISSTLAGVKTLQGLVDAVNVTENQRAVMCMSPMALCHRLGEMGFETIMHLTCRDRNRLALQSDLLAAHALGIHNILAMSGDHPTMGDHPSAKPVFDLDSVQLLQLIERMNNGYDLQDKPLNGATSICAGAVANPGARPLGPQLLKLNKKVLAQASFIQTQAVFDADVFNEFAGVVKHMGIPIIAGIIPLRSAQNARFMNEKIPGVKIPDEVISRMERASGHVSERTKVMAGPGFKETKVAVYPGSEGIKAVSRPALEGIRIAAETIAAIRTNCQGIHIMPIGGHGNTRLLLGMCGLD